ACGFLLLSGCATQSYMARHANASQLASIHELHVLSVIKQDKLDAQRNSMYLNAVPIGAVTGAAIAGGLIAGALISAEANHEANVFADKYVAPLRASLAGYDSRAAIRQALEQGVETIPVRVTDWKAMDTGVPNADLLPAKADTGSAWLILRSRYAMTPDFSGLQVTTQASLYVAGPASEWRSKPAYSNSLTYQSSLLQMPAKTDAERLQMTEAENARYAKLEIDKQIAEINGADAYDPAVARKRRKVQDEQWQHQAKLKQIASPTWSVDERAEWFVQQWQKGGAASLKQAMTEGGQQTARMVALDIMQPEPANADSGNTEWRTVYRDAQRSIQDAPDGEVYSVANGDITHGAAHVNQTYYFSAPATGAR
ncbi:MAG TPA: hypothetical protein VJ722_01360, partial [Rhodanobacteraceae bacterium]|nr:hypothetical protein [Rhodanobacteraceae bacterium]